MKTIRRATPYLLGLLAAAVTRAAIVSLALLAASCGQAEASREGGAQQKTEPAATATPESSPAAAPRTAVPAATPGSPATAQTTPTPARATSAAVEQAREAVKQRQSSAAAAAVAMLNQTWNATLESNPLAKGWVKLTLTGTGKVKLEGEMPDNDINDGFMAEVVSFFGEANIENHIKKFPQPCGRDGKSCGQDKKQAAPQGPGA
jgi:hypothetical protein